MLKFIKNLFYPEPANHKAVVVPIDYDELARKELEQNKAKWEAANELKKKHDACYLNTTKTAFYGTYEEYCANNAANRMVSFNTNPALQQGARGGGNPYAGSGVGVPVQALCIF